MASARPRIRAVLFDLGGTLVREPDFARWVEEARRLDLSVRPDRLPPAYVEVLVEVNAEGGPQETGALATDFWQRVLSRTVQANVPRHVATKFVAACGEGSAPVLIYPDAHGCLDQLRTDRRSLGVISNSTNEEIVRLVLSWAGILDFFDCIVSSGTEGVEKPDPEIFLRTVRRMGLRPAEAIYVGNQPFTDAVAAQSAGLYGVWLNRGEATHSTTPPEITSLLQIPSCVRRIERGLLPVSSD